MKRDWFKHVAEIHGGKQDLQSELCDQDFPQKNIMQEHNAQVHEVKKRIQIRTRHLKCSRCGYKSDTNMGINKHIRKHHEGENVKIINIAPEKALKKSVRKMKELIVDPSEIENQIFDPIKTEDVYMDNAENEFNEETITEHFEVHEEENPFCCSICNSGFDSEASLLEHYESVHDSGMAEHQEQGFHEQMENFEPEIEFQNQDQNDGKSNWGHNNVTETFCTQCEASFKNKAYLKHHIATVHDGIKTWECQICAKTFSYKNKLQSHISNVHEKQKPFKCSACGYSAGIKGNVTKHILSVHGGAADVLYESKDKEHDCTFCDFKCSWRPDLLKHIKEVHDGNWKCPICSKIFTYQNKLQLHMASVHEKQKPFKCSVCDYKAGIKGNVTKHIQKQHFGEGDVLYDKKDKQSNEPKLKRDAPIMPFLFGGINHVRPIELTKIGQDKKYSKSNLLDSELIKDQNDQFASISNEEHSQSVHSDLIDPELIKDKNDQFASMLNL